MAEGSGPAAPKKRGDLVRFNSDKEVADDDTLILSNIIKVLDISPNNLGDLAINLGIPQTKIEVFKYDTKCFNDERTSIINFWLDNDKERSWGKLQRALYAVNETKAGDKIGDEFLGKKWKDPRKQDSWAMFIPKINGVQFVKGTPPNGLLAAPKPNNAYFRTIPTSRSHHNESWLNGRISELRDKMWAFCHEVEPHQRKFKVGYEARFGRIYWNLSSDYDGRGLPVHNVYKKKRNFVPHIYCEVNEVLCEKCHPPDPDHLRWHVDPLKFVVHGDAHKGIKYVAVLMEDKEGHYHLRNVYEQRNRTPKAKYDIMRSGSKYDIRIGDCFALVSQTEDKRVRQIADDIARSTHRIANDNLEMPLFGKDFHVVFLRFKKQQQHLWKNNDE